MVVILLRQMKFNCFSQCLAFIWGLCLLYGNIFSSASALGDDFVRRIVGGKETEANEWPWMVALLSVGEDNPAESQFCGGALIHPWWVITASHCLTSGSADSFEVAIGIRDLRNDPESSYRRIGIEEVYLHPAYETALDPSIDGDIALLRLAEPVFDIPVLPLVHQYELIQPGVNGTVIGWGKTTDGGHASDVLLEVELPIVSQEEANATEAYDTDLSVDMLPAGFIEGGKDSCEGDSGGPFVVPMGNGEWGLAGIVSFGSPLGCAAPNAHGIYASVPFFYGEIMSLMYSSYDQWRLENQVESIQGDKDEDGVLDFAEYAFGSDPSNGADRPQFKFVQTSGPRGELLPGIQFKRARSHEEVRYVVESSMDLQTWSSIEDGIFDATDNEEWIFKTSNPITSHEAQFLRIRVEPPRDAPAPEFFQHAIRLKGNLNNIRDFVYSANQTVESVTLQYAVDQKAFEPKVTILDEETGQILSVATEHQEGEIRHTFLTTPDKSYRIRLSGMDDTATGPYHFNIPPVDPSDDESDLDTENIAVGDVVAGVLEATDLIEQGEYGDDYLLTGLTAGDVIRITLKAGPENPALLPTITLYDWSFFNYIADSFDQESNEVSVTFTAQEGLDYLIAVGHLEENQIGEYILSVELQ